MAYTFSRRDFMKYTALAAAAVAVSGSLTGCSGNPNQPTGKIGDTLSFGGSSGIFGIGGNSDKHTLVAEGTAYNEGALNCVFEHYPVTDGTSCTVDRYQLRIVKEDGTVQWVIASKAGVVFSVTNGSGSLKKEEKITNTLKITGLAELAADAKEVYIQYYPRHNALGNENDAYSDVFATWDITSLFVEG